MRAARRRSASGGPVLTLPVLLAAAVLAAAPPRVDADSAAAAALRDFAGVCARAGTRLWGRSLCGRLLLVDPATRRAVANAPDGGAALAPAAGAPAGVFVGTLPDSVGLANTAVRWADADWAMVLLPLP